MTPLTEQKSLNLHDEKTACDQVQHSLFRAVVGKLQYITGVRPDLMFATKCLSYTLASPTLADLHLRVVRVASESNLADMLTKAHGRSKIEEFCAEIGQTEPCAETLDKESKGVKKTKEVKFAVEAIEMDEAVKNRFKDARIARAKNKLKDARIARIKNESKVEKLQWMHAMD